MSDRRRTQRFVLGSPLAAEVMSMQDVIVERLEGDLITIVSLAPHEPGRQMLIHVPTSAGSHSYQTKVVSSTPIAVGASVQFRVELRIAAQTGESANS